MTLTIPPEPAELSPEIPPPGYRKALLSFNDERKIITPRIALVHTNGAEREGSIEASTNWAERRVDAEGNATTCPTFQVDRDGDAAMLLELNRAQNANYQANPFSLSFETADRGWATDPYPTGSYFTEPQLQLIANGLAYVHMLYGISLAYPMVWDGEGCACHTEPFAHPYWTKYAGKPCPGDRKKQQMRDTILPLAQTIVDAWQGVTPPPPEDDDMALSDEDVDRIARRVLTQATVEPTTGRQVTVEYLLGLIRGGAANADRQTRPADPKNVIERKLDEVLGLLRAE